MILDGGLGVELACRGFVYSTKLWSGETLLTSSDLLVAVHRAYLAAGAQVIETATYQLCHAALRELDCDDAAIDEIFARAVRLARDAIAAERVQTGAAGTAVVAASLGPYGATVGDRSEYSRTPHVGRAELYAFHAERSRSVARAAPDMFLFETIPTHAEALAIAEVARDLGLANVWLSLACADGEFTYGGDRASAIAHELDAFACIDVVGVNCTAPAAIAGLVRSIQRESAKPVVVCPNIGSGEADLVRRVPEWLALGVAHIGGCCGVGPSTIAAIAAVAADRAA